MWLAIIVYRVSASRLRQLDSSYILDTKVMNDLRFTLADVGGNQRRDTDGMVIYVGEGAGMNGIYNTPYFDQEMVSNYTVQASGNDLIKSKTIMHCF